MAPRLAGRDEILATAVEAAARRPGVLAIAGPPGVGTTRLARELAARLALDGAVVVDAEGPAEDAGRIARALEAEGHNPDPLWAARLLPLVVLAGDVPGGDLLEAARLCRRLAGSRALILMTADHEIPDVPTIVLDPLDDHAAAALVADVAPELPPDAVRAVTELGTGLPARLIALAVAARRRRPGGPLPIPTRIARPFRARIARLEDGPRDVLGWLAVMAGPCTAAEVAGAMRCAVDHAERGLEALERAGLTRELPGPPAPAWEVADPLAAAVIREMIGPAEVRRRYAGALLAARLAGAASRSLLQLAEGAGDGAAVVRYGARAAREARIAGDPAAALGHADRALEWWRPAAHDEDLRLAALHERGLALLDMARWAAAAEALEEAAAGRARRRDRDGALASATGAARALWSLGRHGAATHLLQRHLDRDAHTRAPSPELAEALTQAARMAVLAGRFARAMSLAGEARTVARAVGEDRAAVRALIFLGLAEAGRGAGAGLSHMARARREGAGTRDETLAMVNHAGALLALGRPGDAATVARAGVARARAMGIAEHRHQLEGILGEALAAQGRLEEAGEWLERAAAGWAELALPTPTPADPARAWLLLAEGRIDAALSRHRAVSESLAATDSPFPQRAATATGHAIAALTAGHPDEAVAHVAGAIAAWRETDDRLVSPPLFAVAAELPDAELARVGMATLEEMASAPGTADSALEAFRRYARGQVGRRARSAAAARDLLAAAGLFDGAGLAWWAARALLAAGAASNERDAAVEALLTARTRYREMGAEQWSRRAEARLRALGVRVAAPQRRAAAEDAPTVLSAREQEVLELLALGLRNREIGERLFISERTVARHLVQMYAKLGVSSRTEAVHVARERGLIDTGAPTP